MTKASREKAQATKVAQREEWSRQVVKPCKGWTLKRFDEANWAIIRDEDPKRPWFYGRLLHALQDLPHKLLKDGDKRSLQDIADQMAEIRKIIDRLDLAFLKTLDCRGKEMSI